MFSKYQVHHRNNLKTVTGSCMFSISFTRSQRQHGLHSKTQPGKMKPKEIKRFVLRNLKEASTL